MESVMKIRSGPVGAVILLVSLSTHSGVDGSQTGEKSQASVLQGELAAASKADAREWGVYVQELDRISRLEDSKTMNPEAAERAKSEAWLRFCAPVSPVSKDTDRLLELISKNPNDPAAVEALSFVVLTTRNFPTDQARRAANILLRNHVRDAKISQFTQKGFVLFYVPEAEQLLRAVLEQNPSADERGRVCYDVAYFLLYQAEKLREMRKKPENIKDFAESWRQGLVEKFVREKDPESLTKEAEALLERCVTEFATVPGVDHFDGRLMGDVARRKLFEIRNLRIGKVAPDIQGVDAEGRSFRLSGYRGKVVVLTFSGNWCGPCQAIYPHLRELVGRLKEKPFVLVSVNTDKERQTLTKSIRDGEITWRCWFDGGTGGPITTAWGVTSFPEIYVIDSKGVIRHKNVSIEELGPAVDVLLRETPAQKSEL
jgi:thiol-disulfide isomerase/thioredoxin